jgi:hypothetical protein
MRPAEQCGDRQPGTHGLDHATVGSDVGQPLPKVVALVGGDQVRLVQQQGPRQQLLQHVATHVTIDAAPAHRLGVGNDDHAIEPEARQVRVLCGGHRIRHATGFDDHPLRWLRAIEDAQHRLHQATCQRAADASVGKTDRVAIGSFDQVGIDLQCAEVVDQHRNAEPVGVAQEVVHQRGLAGAQVATDDGDRNRWLRRLAHSHAG